MNFHQRGYTYVVPPQGMHVCWWAIILFAWVSQRCVGHSLTGTPISVTAKNNCYIPGIPTAHFNYPWVTLPSFFNYQQKALVNKRVLLYHMYVKILSAPSPPRHGGYGWRLRVSCWLAGGDRINASFVRWSHIIHQVQGSPPGRACQGGVMQALTEKERPTSDWGSK